MRIKVFLFCISLFIGGSSLFAQDSIPNIIHDLNMTKPGEGKIRIMQDASIDASLASYVPTDTLSHPKLSNEMMKGFKIQAFVGNNQNISREEAEERQRLIRQTFPDQQALVTYDSPSWRLRVGNFVDRYQAEQFMIELKNAFPSFAKEMYVVSDKIRKPLR